MNRIFPALWDQTCVVANDHDEDWCDLPDPRRDPWTGRIRPVFIDENPNDEWEF